MRYSGPIISRLKSLVNLARTMRYTRRGREVRLCIVGELRAAGRGCKFDWWSGAGRSSLPPYSLVNNTESFHVVHLPRTF